MTLSQLLPSLSSSSSGSSPSSGDNSNSGSLDSGTSSGSSSSVYSPLLSIIDYLQSLQSPKTYQTAAASSASKRKSTGIEPDEFLASANAVDGSTFPSANSQTPCASKEEYISPTYARNYQGVWKYVVQIPNEGYFTQTVQQTTCLKTKCDLLEGACRESPRYFFAYF